MTARLNCRSIGFLCVLVCVTVNAEEGSNCEFKLVQIERRYDYFADFVITVTNKGNNSVSVKHFAAPPFKIVYRQGDRQYPLKHKADWYATEHGASRSPEERTLESHTVVSFPVDLKGDYVVVIGGRAVPFREFAQGKQGVVDVLALQDMLACDSQGKQNINFDGLSPVRGKSP